MNGPFLENAMDHLEKEAWQSLRNMVDNVLEKRRMPCYKDIVQNLLEHFKILGCNMNIKLHFLH
jgi:hypothetical protein